MLVAAAMMSAAAIVGTPAAATPLLFSFDGVAGPSSDFSFILDSSPSVTNPGSQSFDVSNVNMTYGGSGLTEGLTFYTLSDGGGLADDFNLFDLYGEQLFTGSTSAPTFLTGTFELANVAGGEAGILTISTAAVPEPATWAMLVLGFGALGIAVRRSKKVLAAA